MMPLDSRVLESLPAKIDQLGKRLDEHAKANDAKHQNAIRTLEVRSQQALKLLETKLTAAMKMQDMQIRKIVVELEKKVVELGKKLESRMKRLEATLSGKQREQHVTQLNQRAMIERVERQVKLLEEKPKSR